MYGYTPITRHEAHDASIRLIPACIIVSSLVKGQRFYYAFSPDAKLLSSHTDFNEVDRAARYQGFAPVSSNSLAAAKIRDDFRGQGYCLPAEDDPSDHWGDGDFDKGLI